MAPSLSQPLVSLLVLNNDSYMLSVMITLSLGLCWIHDWHKFSTTDPNYCANTDKLYCFHNQVNVRKSTIISIYIHVNFLSNINWPGEAKSLPPHCHKCSLRSCSQELLSVPRSRTVTYSDRAFSIAGPRLWNELPFSLRKAADINAFKRQLKPISSRKFIFKICFTLFHL